MSSPSLLQRYGPPVAVFFLVIALWELLVRTFNVQQFLLPAPTVIVEAFFRTTTNISNSAAYTIRSAVLGFGLGAGAGVLVALITARWTTLREGLMPFAIALNSVPIIAFAPIMNNWFGSTNPLSKIAIVAIITFFPMMINMVRGLTLVDPAKLELMRSYATTPLQVLIKVRIPNALPYLFNALKVCSTLSLIGAIVGEYFGGPRDSLGVYILQEAQLFRFDNAWAAIIISALLGIAFYLVIIGLERIAIPWHASIDKQ
jgi:NitT/TauT family transport system permease protein